MTVILDLCSPSSADKGVVGGKAFWLGQALSSVVLSNFIIPKTEVLSADFFDEFCRFNKIDNNFLNLAGAPTDKLKTWSELQQSKVLKGEFSESMFRELKNLFSHFSSDGEVIVRSSSCIEDGLGNSAAGQFLSVGRIVCFDDFISAIKQVYSSLYSVRSLAYRQRSGINFVGRMAIMVQPYLYSKQSVSGVAFSVDVRDGSVDKVSISANYGNAESVVSGEASPDEFIVSKIGEAKGRVIERRLGEKQVVSCIQKGVVHYVETDNRDRTVFCLSDHDVTCLAEAILQLEQALSIPIDVEWMLDSEGNRYLLQVRPETVFSKASTIEAKAASPAFIVEERKEAFLFDGINASTGIAIGPVLIAELPEDIPEDVSGFILVTDSTNPNWEPVMQRAAAIVTRRGGRNCHTAIIAREMHLPAMVGCGDASACLIEGGEVTLVCREGKEGRLYSGDLRTLQNVD
jgi:pyruvate,water dikinase